MLLSPLADAGWPGQYCVLYLRWYAAYWLRLLIVITQYDNSQLSIFTPQMSRHESRRHCRDIEAAIGWPPRLAAFSLRHCRCIAIGRARCHLLIAADIEADDAVSRLIMADTLSQLLCCMMADEVTCYHIELATQLASRWLIAISCLRLASWCW